MRGRAAASDQRAHRQYPVRHTTSECWPVSACSYKSSRTCPKLSCKVPGISCIQYCSAHTVQYCKLLPLSSIAAGGPGASVRVGERVICWYSVSNPHAFRHDLVRKISKWQWHCVVLSFNTQPLMRCAVFACSFSISGHKEE